MPIRQHKTEYDRGNEHIEWLKNTYPNVSNAEVNLTSIFEEMENTYDKTIQDFLTMANTRARLRMTTLYAYAGHYKLLVAGTGNKVEDFGVGFYTKYGDGGVDISPIADCLKSQVWEMGKELKILEDIINAAPTDGLWADGRTDERQLGMSYVDLEKAMLNLKDKNYEKYLKIRKRNLHKMNLIPICKFDNNTTIMFTNYSG